MAQIAGAYFRDANGVPIINDGIIVSKSITYAAATTGAIAASVLFTVTGDVIVNVFAVCSVSLDSGGASTIEVGITSNTASLIALTTATTIDAGHVWLDATPGTVQPLPTANILTNGTDVSQKITDATITAGALTYYCAWRPLSSDGNVVAA